MHARDGVAEKVSSDATFQNLVLAVWLDPDRGHALPILKHIPSFPISKARKDYQSSNCHGLICLSVKRVPFPTLQIRDTSFRSYYYLASVFDGPPSLPFLSKQQVPIFELGVDIFKSLMPNTFSSLL